MTITPCDPLAGVIRRTSPRTSSPGPVIDRNSSGVIRCLSPVAISNLTLGAPSRALSHAASVANDSFVNADHRRSCRNRRIVGFPRTGGEAMEAAQVQRVATASIAFASVHLRRHRYRRRNGDRRCRRRRRRRRHECRRGRRRGRMDRRRATRVSARRRAGLPAHDLRGRPLRDDLRIAPDVGHDQRVEHSQNRPAVPLLGGQSGGGAGATSLMRAAPGDRI